MVFLKNALMCNKKSQINYHDCLPILMLLYIMLYIVLAYLMLFAALTNSFFLSFRLIPKKLMSSYTGMEECQKTNTTTKRKM